MGPSMLKIQSLLNPTAVAVKDSNATPSDELPSQNMPSVSTPSISSTQPSPSAFSSTFNFPFTHPFSLTNTPSNTPQPSSTMASKKGSKRKAPATQTQTPAAAAASASNTANANANNTTNLVVRFPPYEPNIPPPNMSQAEITDLANGHQACNLLPRSGTANDLIANGTVDIPYRSDKNSFNRDTHKYDVKVFEYSFIVPKKPGKGKKAANNATAQQDHSATKVWHIRWDRYDGLTQVTNYFKSLDHVKTTVGRAIDANDDLSTISWNFLGGAIPAQGYWMPYTCARALALTFCYEIRYALTPIFGPSFVHECLLPTDPNFGNFTIDNTIVQVARAAWANGSPALTTTSATISGNVPTNPPSAPANPTTTAPAISPAVSPKTVPAALPGWNAVNNGGGMLGAKRRSLARKGRKYVGMPGTEGSPLPRGTYVDPDGMPYTKRYKIEGRGRKVRARTDPPRLSRYLESVARDEGRLPEPVDSESDDEDIVIPPHLLAGGAEESAVRGAVEGLALLRSHGREE